MKKRDYQEQELIGYLESMADLDGFYVFRSPNIQPGLINYVDRSGGEWSLMEDDNEFVAACIEFLTDRGNPIFGDHTEESEHVAGLKQRFGNSNT